MAVLHSQDCCINVMYLDFSDIQVTRLAKNGYKQVNLTVPQFKF